MIGGEFDLSVGSTVGAAGMAIMLLTTVLGWSVWPALAAAAVLSVAIGLLNGYTVVRTGLPSFIVTLATLLIVRGLTIALARALTGRTQLGGLDQTAGFQSASLVFASEPLPGWQVSVVWWLVAAVVASWVLHRSPRGNWIFAAGGEPQAARNMGVPVARVKVGLFVTTALCAWLVASLQALRFTGADVLRGQFQEFYAITAAVIGGTHLTGGFGSVVGAVLGALILGMVRQGIVMTGVDADWYQVVLGGMLLLAVLANRAARRQAHRAG